MPTSATINVGATQQLTATVLPANAANRAITWTSNNPAIARVAANGLVTGVAAGTATITVTTADGGFRASSTIIVVTAPAPPTVAPTVDNPKWTGNFRDDTERMILARAIFGEARGESDEGRIAVGWVIRNRVEDENSRKRWRWGAGYHGVILQRGQFSAFNPRDRNRPFVEDPLRTDNELDRIAWRRCYEIAGQILNNTLNDPTNGATHFFSPKSQREGFGPYDIPETGNKSLIPFWALPTGYNRDSPPPLHWKITELYQTRDLTEWVGKLNNVSNWDFMFYRPIRADTTLPTITISSPLSGQTFTTPTITVRGSAADNVAVSRVEVRVGTGVWQLATGTTSWSGQVTLASGSNTITVRAIDVAGNIGTASVTVVVTPAPAIEAARWAENRVGTEGWRWGCLNFVANAYDRQGAGWDTAILMARELTLTRSSPENAPIGALVFWDAAPANGHAGHVGIHVGGGNVVHAIGRTPMEVRVRQDNMRGLSIRDTGIAAAPYIGWATAPAVWRTGNGGRNPDFSGRVIVNGRGLAGVSMELFGNVTFELELEPPRGPGPVTITVRTDSNGYFEFWGLPRRTFTITPNKTGYSFNPSQQSRIANHTQIAPFNASRLP
jgi:hypothetical protein